MNFYILFAIAIGILVVIFLWTTNPSRVLKNSYEGVVGYNYNENAKKVIEAGKRISNPSNIEKFRIGNVKHYNAGDVEGAMEEYTGAIHNMRDHPLEVENLFILDRISGDYAILPPNNIPEIIPRTRDHVTQSLIRESIIDKSKPKKEAKVAAIDRKEQWTIDVQNVHDTQINKKLREHFVRIKEYNTTEYGELTHAAVEGVIDSIKKYIRKNSNGDDRRTEGNRNTNAMNIVNGAARGLSVMGVGTEQEVIVELWRRINSKDNDSNVDELKKSFVESMDNCVQGGNVVCTQGRVTNMVQSLAHMDKDEELGLMRTTEAIRNAVYKDASSILNRNLETLSKADLDSYNQDKTNKRIKSTEAKARKEIAEMVTTTEGLAKSL